MIVVLFPLISWHCAAAKIYLLRMLAAAMQIVFNEAVAAWFQDDFPKGPQPHA